MKFLILLLVISCSIQKKSPLSILNDLHLAWIKQATKEDIIKILGNDFKESDDGIIFSSFADSIYQSGHYFNSSNKLEEQFIILDHNSLIKLKSTISCKWDEKSNLKAHGHTVHSKINGKCTDQNIGYHFRAGNNNYELRWRK